MRVSLPHGTPRLASFEGSDSIIAVNCILLSNQLHSLWVTLPHRCGFGGLQTSQNRSMAFALTFFAFFFGRAEIDGMSVFFCFFGREVVLAAATAHPMPPLADVPPRSLIRLTYAGMSNFRWQPL